MYLNRWYILTLLLSTITTEQWSDLSKLDISKLDFKYLAEESLNSNMGKSVNNWEVFHIPYLALGTPFNLPYSTNNAYMIV